MEHGYKYDIALSLCKEDTEFARQLVAQLNPGLKVFYYENNQEEIISQSGPDVFGRVFKESRLVVILSRKSWSETFYTKIEMHSINDRVKTEGFDFLVVIPMVQGETPAWYPQTLIYADPKNMGVDVIAKIVEYNVTRLGGVIKQVTLEDNFELLQKRIEDKKALIQLQSSNDALQDIEKEIDNLYQIIQQKMDYLSKGNPTVVSRNLWPSPDMGTYFRMGNYILEISLSKAKPGLMFNPMITSQDYSLTVRIYKIIGYLSNLWEPSQNKKPVGGKNYKYIYSPVLKGWAVLYVHNKNVTAVEKQVLFSYRDSMEMQETYYYYDLKDPVSSTSLVDQWYKELLKLAAKSINNYV